MKPSVLLLSYRRYLSVFQSLILVIWEVIIVHEMVQNEISSSSRWLHPATLGLHTWGSLNDGDNIVLDSPKSTQNLKVMPQVASHNPILSDVDYCNITKNMYLQGVYAKVIHFCNIDLSGFYEWNMVKNGSFSFRILSAFRICPFFEAQTITECDRTA